MTEWKYEKNGETIVRTCAWSPPGCHPAGCGLKLHVKDGKLVKVEGDPEHPITKGALCPRCLALIDYIYHPDRIIYPMKRDRKDRGLDKWERCTWDEAYDIILTNWKRITDEYGKESMVVFGGTGREATQYYGMFANTVFGTPNSCYAQSGWSCYGPRLSFTTFSIGYGFPEIDNAAKHALRFDDPNWEAPKYILLWGKEPLKSNPDGFWGHSIIEMARECGSKIIMIDPRMTWLGTRSEEVVRLRPGTDAALAMALLNVIINEDLYDHEWVEKWTYGFDQLAERVQEMPPSKAAEICWVEEEQIVRVARKLAAAKPFTTGWGLAVDQNPNGAQVAQCIIALNAILGQFDIPGGWMLGRFNMHPIANTTAQAMEAGILPKERYAKRVGVKEFPAVCAIMPTADPDAMLDCLESDDPYPIRMAMFQSSNVISAAISSATGRWYRALKDKMEFCFVTDTFMNPTAMALCEVFLPIASFAEHDSIVDPNYGGNLTFVGALNKAIQVGECKSDIEILLELGKKLEPDFWNQWEDADDFVDKLMCPPHGVSWQEIHEKVAISHEEPYRKYELGMLRPDGKPGFLTATGRVELYSNAFHQFGDDPLPYYSEPPYSPYSTPELSEKYPLILTTGARTYASFHSEHRQIDSLREIVPYPLVEIHPDTAKELGVEDGQWVWIESPFGKCQQKVNITPIVDRKVVAAMHGWWYPEAGAEEPSLFDCWRSNINLTMPHKVNGKLGFGDCFKNMICRIYPADEWKVGDNEQ